MHLQDKIEELQAQIEAATAESAELAKRNTQWEAELQVITGIFQQAQIPDHHCAQPQCWLARWRMIAGH